MLIPISWLKDYVDIKLPLKELMWKMTEAGLTCEASQNVDGDTVLDVEVTANRPDWMSVLGVAREVAAIQGVNFKEPKIEKIPAPSAKFPIDLVPDFKLFDRWSAIVIKGVKVGPSPDWLQKRIKLMGHSPINNIIDITNFVMYELGMPMHAFDYDEIAGQIMSVQLSKGGEEFTSVDEISYNLPKDAIIIKDSERLIDLAGIKGGLNSGIKESTKNILLHVTINNPVLVRRTSIAMGLRSEASAIYERGPDRGGTIRALERGVDLILKHAGGEVASKTIDIKKENFLPKKLNLSFERLEKVLGIKISDKEVMNILSKLGLNPKVGKLCVSCLIPTYRGDIKIEEDLIEEVARIYGYNKFPLTIPEGRISVEKVPEYYFDDSMIVKIKNIFAASGYSEAKNLSLISKDMIDNFQMDEPSHFRITNPVSLEYEYMRVSLVPELVTSIKINSQPNIKLFEIDKAYTKTVEGASEKYKVAAVFVGENFRKFKSVVDLLLERLSFENYEIEFDTDRPYMHQSHSGTIKIGSKVLGYFGEVSPIVLSKLEIKSNVFCFEFDLEVLKDSSTVKSFNQISSNPAQIEDLTLKFPAKTRVGEVIKLIGNSSKLITDVLLKDSYNDSYTFRVWFQDANKTLTNSDVEKVRLEIVKKLKTKFGGVYNDS